MTGVTMGRGADAVPAIPKKRSWLGVVALLVIVGTQWYAISTSAPDRDMGNLQKIMYVHIPSAWMFFIAFFVVALASLMYLWKREERYDLVAASAAEAGAVFTGMALATGSIWGRPTWGTYWTWDARLTSTAVTFLILVGYLALRSAVDDTERRARWSAAVGILGALNVPIVYMSVRWWRTLHQVQSSQSTVAGPYRTGWQLNALAMTLVLIWFIMARYRAACLERAAESAAENAALGGRA